MIRFGVCREQARYALNPAIYTSWVWTCSLQSALNFVSLRYHSAAQSEICLYAEALIECIKVVAPNTYEIWHEIKEEIDPLIVEGMERVKARLRELAQRGDLLAQQEMMKIIEELITRKLELFPDNRRLIVEFHLQETRNKFHLSVASTMMNED